MINEHMLHGVLNKILLFGSDERKYVRWGIREELQTDCIQATVKNPVSVMILSYMSADIIGPHHVINGILNDGKYTDTILKRNIYIVSGMSS